MHKMQIRKYTKVFRNRKSLYKAKTRADGIWERSDMPKEYMPDYKSNMVYVNGKPKIELTLTYYVPRYAKTQALQDGDLYGKNAVDAKAKFKDLFAKNFPTQHLVIKSMKLKIDRGAGLKLYSFKYYTKPKR